MPCKAHAEMMDALVALNNKLNLLSPNRVSGREQVERVSERREELLVEIKHHRKKGHDGRPCPSAPRARRGE